MVPCESGGDVSTSKFKLFLDLYAPVSASLLENSPHLITQIESHLAQHQQAAVQGFPVLKDMSFDLNHSAIHSFGEHLEQLLTESISDSFRNIVSDFDVSVAPSNPISVSLDRILAGDGAYLVALSKAHERSLDELAFFAVFLARPIRQLARDRYAEKFGFSGWRLGFCPVCGLWPCMARLDSESGRRSLWCVGCGGFWRFPRMVCPFCLEKDQTKLGFITVEEWEGYRIQTCESCRRYLKTRDKRQTDAIKVDSPEVEYLATSTLDAAAAQEKYIRNFVGFAAFDKKNSEAARKYRSKALNT